MAGAGRRTFTPGEVLTASNVMNYLQDQAVMNFAGTAARGSAIGTAVSEGMVSYLADTNSVEVYDGVGWNQISQASSPNAVINGGMDIWQRGTSFNGAGLLYCADRWTYWRDAYASGITASRQSVSDTTNLPNAKYCLRIARDSGNTGTGNLYTNQPLTNDDSLQFVGKAVTFSGWMRKGANFSGSTVNMIIRSGTGTDQPVNNMTGATTVASGGKTLTTSWQRFSVSGTVNASATQLGVEFNYTPSGTAGAADYFEVTNVQLELGSSATPFRRNANSIQGELAACQRYYFRKIDTGNGSPIGNGTYITTSSAAITVPFPVEMRATPASIDYSVVKVGAIGLTEQAVSAVTSPFNLTNRFGAIIQCVHGAGGSGGAATTCYVNPAQSGYIGFSAEL